MDMRDMMRLAYLRTASLEAWQHFNRVYSYCDAEMTATRIGGRPWRWRPRRRTMRYSGNVHQRRVKRRAAARV